MLKDISAPVYSDGELFEYRDGHMVELDECMAVNPFDEASVAELIRALPRDMCPDVARLVALRAAALEEVPGLMRSV